MMDISIIILLTVIAALSGYLIPIVILLTENKHASIHYIFSRELVDFDMDDLPHNDTGVVITNKSFEEMKAIEYEKELP